MDDREDAFGHPRSGEDTPISAEITAFGLTLGTDMNGGFWLAEAGYSESYTIPVERLGDLRALADGLESLLEQFGARGDG